MTRLQKYKWFLNYRWLFNNGWLLNYGSLLNHGWLLNYGWLLNDDFWIRNDFWIMDDIWIMGDFWFFFGGGGDKQTDRQTDRQIDRQTTETDTHQYHDLAWPRGQAVWKIRFCLDIDNLALLPLPSLYSWTPARTFLKPFIKATLLPEPRPTTPSVLVDISCYSYLKEQNLKYTHSGSISFKITFLWLFCNWYHNSFVNNPES